MECLHLQLVGRTAKVYKDPNFIPAAAFAEAILFSMLWLVSSAPKNMIMFMLSYHVVFMSNFLNPYAPDLCLGRIAETANILSIAFAEHWCLATLGAGSCQWAFWTSSGIRTPPS